MEFIDTLEDVGLTHSESVVYLTLLKLGKTKSGKIIKLSGLQSSVVHNALNSLTDKGFVTSVLDNKIKQYSAINPKILKEYLDNKSKNLQKILPTLISYHSDTESPEIEVYEGYSGLYNATLEMIRDKKSGDIYKYFAAKEFLLNKEALEFFTKIDLLKTEEKLIVRGIAELESKTVLKNYSSSSIKFTKQKIPPAMNIFRDKILIISLKNKPLGILITSKEIASQYHVLWDSIWGEL